MSAHPTITYLPRRLTLVGGLLAALALGSGAEAADAAWTDVDGNPSCADVGSGYREVKIEPVPSGRHAFGDGDLSGVIDVQGVRFDWSANQGVDVVIVKGGPDARVYRAASELTSGSQLRAPINLANGEPYGLSHITFCYDPGKPPAPAPGPCEPGGPVTMPDGRPCHPPAPAPGPCEPGGPLTMPDGRPCNPPGAAPGPCEPGGPVTMPDGRPCHPQAPAPGPCEPGGPATTVDGRPCNEPGTPGGQNAAQGAVLGAGATGTAQRPPARAAMSGASRCVTRPFRQVVRGQGIRRVTFFVNGRRVLQLRGSRAAYAVRIDPRASSTGAMRVTARVEYVAASDKRPQTFRATVLRCARSHAVARQQPRFAG